MACGEGGGGLLTGVVVDTQAALLALCGRDRSNHHGPTRSSESLLQEPGELGVTVGHPRALIPERSNDAAQGEETLVNVAALALSLGTPT